MKVHSEFRRFLYNNLGRTALWMALVVVAIIAWNKWMPAEYLAVIKEKTANPLLIYSIFFLSETIVGIFPPELFMGWGLAYEGMPYWQTVVALALTSYASGMIAYGMGRWIRNLRYVRLRLRTKKARKYVHYYERWGGLLIIISAITPVPFATVSLISGAFNFGWMRYLLYSLSRFGRFAFVAYLIWKAGTM